MNTIAILIYASAAFAAGFVVGVASEKLGYVDKYMKSNQPTEGNIYDV